MNASALEVRSPAADPTASAQVDTTTPKVPVPDPDKPFDLVDNIDWHREQLRVAREKHDIAQQIACSNLLWGMSVGAVLDERGDFTERTPGVITVPKARADEERFSFNNRDYLATEGEFPDMVAYVRWGREYYEAQGSAARVAATQIATGELSVPAPRAEIPERFFEALDAQTDRARSLGLLRRSR